MRVKHCFLYRFILPDIQKNPLEWAIIGFVNTLPTQAKVYANVSQCTNHQVFVNGPKRMEKIALQIKRCGKNQPQLSANASAGTPTDLLSARVTTKHTRRIHRHSNSTNVAILNARTQHDKHKRHFYFTYFLLQHSKMPALAQHFFHRPLFDACTYVYTQYDFLIRLPYGKTLKLTHTNRFNCHITLVCRTMCRSSATHCRRSCLDW